MPSPSLFSFSSIAEALQVFHDLTAIVAAIAVTVTALIGRSALKDWREKKKLGRKVKHAERIVVVACNAREALMRIRSPISFSGEGELAEKAIAKAISKGHRVELNDCSTIGMICLERMRRENRHYLAVSEYIIISEAVFSERLAEALKNILSKYNSVRSAARILVQDGKNITYDQKWFDRVWEGNKGEEKDEICIFIDEQINIVKKECESYIKVNEKKSIWNLFANAPKV